MQKKIYFSALSKMKNIISVGPLADLPLYDPTPVNL